jgi:hypothetical protein
MAAGRSGRLSPKRVKFLLRFALRPLIVSITQEDMTMEFEMDAGGRRHVDNEPPRSAGAKA